MLSSFIKKYQAIFYFSLILLLSIGILLIYVNIDNSNGTLYKDQKAPFITTDNGIAVVMPFPMTVTIDDMGWRSYNLLANYENIKYIGEQTGTRLLGAFIISDFDKYNILADYPTTTSYGKKWNNSRNINETENQIIQYIKDNSAFIEFGLHGVRHGTYSDGELIKEGVEVSDKHEGEWYDVNGHKPWNFTAMQNHAEAFYKISQQYNLSFPRSMVPPSHGYYYNPESSEDTGSLLKKYGLKYVTTDFNSITELKPVEGVYNGILLTNRDRNLKIWSYDYGVVPEGISDTSSGMTHFPNFIGKKIENNNFIANKWINWFNVKIKDNPSRYLPKNNAQLNSQWLYSKYSKMTYTNDTIIIDATSMPEDAYTNELVGNLVLKISMPNSKTHISSAVIDNEQIAGYYEDREYSYIILPLLNKSKHNLNFTVGKDYLPVYILNDGTYNVFSFNYSENISKIDVEMYGTQKIKVKLPYKPTQIISNNPNVSILSYDYNTGTEFFQINITAKDVQGERTELSLIK